MPRCPSCYLDTCDVSKGAGTACSSKNLADLNAARQSDGSYAGLQLLSPIGAGLFVEANLDGLAGYKGTRAPATLTAAETALATEAAIAVAAIGSAPDLFTLFRKRPGLRDAIESRFAALGMTADADNKETARYFLKQCTKVRANLQAAEAACCKLIEGTDGP